MSDYQGRLCPLCGEHIHRVPRHLTDRFLSAVYPVHRYACRSPVCDWEGVLRRRGGPGDLQAPVMRKIEPSQMSTAHRSH